MKDVNKLAICALVLLCAAAAGYLARWDRAHRHSEWETGKLTQPGIAIGSGTGNVMKNNTITGGSGTVVNPGRHGVGTVTREIEFRKPSEIKPGYVMAVDANGNATLIMPPADPAELLEDFRRHVHEIHGCTYHPRVKR